MEIAKEAGALLSYDPNLREALWPSREEARTQILSIWDQADIAKVSEAELEFLTGINSMEEDVVMKLWRPAMKLLLVTLGDQGCKYYARVCFRTLCHLLSNVNGYFVLNIQFSACNLHS
jgi:fructokinase